MEVIYYFAEILVDTDNEGSIYECRGRGFGDFLHEQKATRRRLVPLVKATRFAQRADKGIGPCGRKFT